MFVAIYRWRLQPGLEQDFVANWHRITTLGLAAGSGGSGLFRDAEGLWVAIARWPSIEARDDFFRQFDSAGDEPEMMAKARRAVIERLPEQQLESVIDAWAPFPPANPSATDS